MNSKFLPAILLLSETSATGTGWDSFGNLLIPTRSAFFVKYVKDSGLTSADIDKYGWWKTDLQSYQDWSSVLGTELVARLVIPGTSEPWNPGFCYSCNLITNKVIGQATITASYVQPNCSFAQLQSNSSFPGLTPYINTVLNITNATIPTIQISELWPGKPEDHWLVSKTIVSTCTLTETKVEMKIMCSASGCKSTKQKATPGQPLSSSLFSNQTAANMFLNSLVLSGGSPSSNDSSDAAVIDSLSVGNPAKSSLFGAWKSDYISLSDSRAQVDGVQTAGFTSETLSRLLNGYLTVSQQPLMNRTSDHVMDVLRGAVTDPNYIVANMRGGIYQPQYRLNWIWMVLDFIGCVILLIAASAAVWLRKRTLAPDIFGYVSSLTRDNPMIDLPAGGSTLNGIDRARMMRGVKVKIADVGGDDGLGRVGLAMKNSSSDNVAELKKGKQYL